MQLGFMPNVLVGHSVGGMLGMVLSVEYPDDLKGLVLVDIAPFTMPRTGRAPRPQPPEFFEDEEDARKYIKERYPDFTEEALENRIKYSFVTGDDGKLRRKKTGDAIRGGLSTDLWPYAERMKVPTLLLKGATSQLVSDETRERMEKLVPDLEVVTVEGVGHMIPQGKPAEFLKLLESFLIRLEL
ncbi:2-(acetamidomethylene)succinate hydrolase [subsurface metagenome]